MQWYGIEVHYGDLLTVNVQHAWQQSSWGVRRVWHEKVLCNAGASCMMRNLWSCLKLARSCADDSSSDSDFADDELSPAPQICNSDEDSRLVRELCKFYDGPISELRDFCIRNSKPGEHLDRVLVMSCSKAHHLHIYPQFCPCAIQKHQKWVRLLNVSRLQS